MFKKTVDGVLAGFQKTVQDLREIIAREQKAVAANNTKLIELENANVVATNEMKRAAAIADKLAALIS